MNRLGIGMLILAVLAGPALGGAGERIADALRGRGLAPELVVVLIAMLPIVELRGAVPVGIIVLGLPWWKAMLWAVVGNLLPVFFLLLLLGRVVGWLGHIPVFRRFFDWLFARVRSKGAAIQRYEFWGLVTFVGIPLPVTGAWTAAAAAEVLGLPYWKSMLAIVIGVLMAAVVVTLLSVLGERYRWAGYALVGLLAAALVYAVVGVFRRPRRSAAGDR